jgi:hypothetical protein
MRTSQKTVASMLSEARKAMGLKTRHEVFDHTVRIDERIRTTARERYDVGVTGLSPYADSSWTIALMKNAGHGRCAYKTVYVTIQEIINSDALVERIAAEAKALALSLGQEGR